MLCSISIFRFYMHKQVVNILRTMVHNFKAVFLFFMCADKELCRTTGVFVSIIILQSHACHTIRLIEYDLTAIQSREHRINCLYNEISGIPPKKMGDLCRCVSMCMRVGIYINPSVHCTTLSSADVPVPYLFYFHTPEFINC